VWHGRHAAMLMRGEEGSPSRLSDPVTTIVISHCRPRIPHPSVMECHPAHPVLPPSRTSPVWLQYGRAELRSCLATDDEPGFRRLLTTPLDLESRRASYLTVFLSFLDEYHQTPASQGRPGPTTRRCGDPIQVADSAGRVAAHFVVPVVYGCMLSGGLPRQRDASFCMHTSVSAQTERRGCSSV